jgi:pimeloyl-ACP methyl ester carboxylesterase
MPAPELIVANISDTVHLAYLDSGPVPNSNDFVTIIWIHGFLFNACTNYSFSVVLELTTLYSDNMERLLPFAHKYNIRLILVMRRDYPGSSPFTDEDKALAAENRELFFKTTGALYLQFMHHILKNTYVCKATEDRSKGGICLAAWSLGNGFAMWTARENDLLDKKVYDDLEPYFNTYIFIGKLIFIYCHEYNN